METFTVTTSEKAPGAGPVTHTILRTGRGEAVPVSAHGPCLPLTSQNAQPWTNGHRRLDQGGHATPPFAPDCGSETRAKIR